MNRISQIFIESAGLATKAGVLATVFAALTLVSGNLFAGPLCYGGSVIKNSIGQIVGCAFNNWGTAEKQMCNGSTVFVGPNSSNCHICVLPPYDQQVANNNFGGLTLTPVPYPGQTPLPPTTFACLKCAPPPDGLTAWWTLDETAGAVRDLTGNLPLDGLIVGGAPSVIGEVGNAMHFNGINQYVEIPSAPKLNVGPGAADGSGDFSIDAWVKIDPGSNAAGVRVIFEKRAANPYRGYSLYLYNRYLGLQLAGGTAGYANYGAPSLVVKDDGKWHFVAVSVKRVPGAFDVQFSLDPATNPSVDVYSPVRNEDLSSPSVARIGMQTIAAGSVFNGAIDEVEFFNRAVTPAEWQSIQSAGCYGKCGARAMPVPTPPSPGNCTWNPITKIWTNCTN